MESVARGTASFQVRADLEHHLLTLLKRSGIEGVSAFLRSLPRFDFEVLGESSEDEARFASSIGFANRRLVVATVSGPHHLSVDVTVEDDAPSEIPADPRHKSFYDTWESLVGVSDDDVAQLDPRRRAVFYVGLLEAEVMNGGFGQYLSNTQGVHVAATLRCLGEIGATKTASLLERAAELGATEDSFADAWAERAETFNQLDDEFLASGEDLAGLAADTFLKPDGQ